MNEVEKLDGFRKIAGWHTVVLAVLSLAFWLSTLPTETGYDVGISFAPLLAGLCLIGAVMAFVAMVGLWSMTQTEDTSTRADEYADA